MQNIDSIARNAEEVLSLFKKDVFESGKFKDLYSEEFGNLEETIADLNARLKSNITIYKDKKKQNKAFPGTFETEYQKALIGLNYTLNEVDKFWCREVLPMLKKELDSVPQKVETGVIKITQESKQEFLDHVGKTVGVVNKILSSGKKVWELVTEHKEFFLMLSGLF